MSKRHSDHKLLPRSVKVVNQINVQGKEIEYLDPKLFRDTPELSDDDKNY